jgi:hypothetical protein
MDRIQEIRLKNNPKIKNYYEILHVSPLSTQKEITEGHQKALQAFQSEALAHYSLFSEENRKQEMALIEEAYLVLQSPEKRRRYDEAKGIHSHVSDEEVARYRQHSLEEERKHDGHMAKLINKQKYHLEYPIDEQFEAELASATHFTGAYLKKIREYKNVEIPRMVELTKVSKTHLLNIEASNIDALPALAYTRGFVYQYAKCLRLNPDLVANSYIEHLQKK